MDDRLDPMSPTQFNVAEVMGARVIIGATPRRQQLPMPPPPTDGAELGSNLLVQQLSSDKMRSLLTGVPSHDAVDEFLRSRSRLAPVADSRLVRRLTQKFSEEPIN